MKKNRLIPILLLKNGWLVQSKGFKKHQNLGNPITSVKRLSEWASDELIYLDITRDNVYDMNRDDQNYPNRKTIFEIIEDVSKVAFMPVTVGGKIRTLHDIEKRLVCGADKVSINTQAFEKKGFVNQAAKEFGSQCIVISIDVRFENEVHNIYTNGGRIFIDRSPIEWGKYMENEGAGEILLNSIDRDGMRKGYDIELLKLISNAVKIPVIACGGVGEWSHLAEAFKETNVDAVAAANIFHYSDQSVYLAKKYLYENNFNVRKPDILNL